MPKQKRKANPFTKKNLMQFRADNEEANAIHTKAVMFAGGVVSEFLREAALNYKPIKRVSK